MIRLRVGPWMKMRMTFQRRPPGFGELGLAEWSHPRLKKVIGMSSRSDEYDPDPVLAFEPFQVKSMTAEPVVRSVAPVDDADGDLDENGAPRRRRRRSSAT